MSALVLHSRSKVPRIKCSRARCLKVGWAFNVLWVTEIHLAAPAPALGLFLFLSLVLLGSPGPARTAAAAAAAALAEAPG